MKRVLLILLLMHHMCMAQIPVELFTGHERATFDVLFFKNFLTKEEKKSYWLFFNRNRLSVDYRITSTNYLPSFGATEAISYNDPKWKGWAPVAVVQIFNNGVFPKAGIQYVHIKKHFTFFSWLVTETNVDPDIDHFILMRYTPIVKDQTQLFIQLETVSVFPTVSNSLFSFTQRSRMGLQYKHFQSGIGIDLNQRGRKTLTYTNNIGLFFRYDFQ
ncbi:MAG: hypothetical protein HYI21_14355 [Sediminibacterium sp. Gen4]|jgi:hypothetical protein|uniref:hypothetical protein n=1 Tax=unclassified Sediminibacterium TaxID=2635961 RepID=UPI0015C1126D|nr:MULTISPECIES: hypothetical protein [unclassified Sediminibacterium]MBW0160748.1 hypothetical protein [Sediminibacterium sp.]MBW0164107.1 hypothetical protein [Sediminibacterium sp.]NWK67207.1 hypothetical protein [Sediminibacterium sp. Gen4]